jgi:hypothetical protein
MTFLTLNTAAKFLSVENTIGRDNCTSRNEKTSTRFQFLNAKFLSVENTIGRDNCTSRNEKTSTRFQFLNRDFLIVLCTTSFCHITQHSIKQGDTSETTLFADNSSLKASAAYMRSIMSGLR